jgi:hypothetical protein
MSHPPTGTASGDVLVRYRLVGGPAGVDQRLTLYEDGLVELDERHRSRDRTKLTLGGSDLGRLRDALDRIPESCWSHGSMLGLVQARRGVKRFFTPWPEMDLGASFFELRRGRRRICGETGEEGEAEEARALLDNLRAHAVGRAEELRPTGT